MTDGEYVSDAFIYMRGREVDYPTFDVDNHLYENRDALTKFLALGVRRHRQVRRDQRTHEGGVQGSDQ